MAGLFDAAQLVTAEQAARLYGIRFHGKRAFCPFHDDGRHPALAFKEGKFNCFACGAHGDSIDFVQQLNGVSNLEAARQLNADFGLGLSDSLPNWEALSKMRRDRIAQRQKEQAVTDAHSVLCWAWRYLRDNAPDSPERFKGAYPQLLREKHWIGWLLDEMEEPMTNDGQFDLLMAYEGVVSRGAGIRRIADSARQSLGQYHPGL